MIGENEPASERTTRSEATSNEQRWAIDESEERSTKSEEQSDEQ